MVKDQTNQDVFNYARFKEQLQIQVISNNADVLELELSGIEAATANALRRIIIAEIPTMAFHKVLLFQNTSVIPDELLIHRLGLLPIKTDAADFDNRLEGQEVNAENSIKYELKVICRRKKEY